MKKLLILICFLHLIRCDYALEEEYYKAMAPPGSEDIQLLLPEEGDTLYLFTRILLQYDLELGAEMPVELEVFLNDDPVATGILSLFHIPLRMPL